MFEGCRYFRSIHLFGSHARGGHLLALSTRLFLRLCWHVGSGTDDLFHESNRSRVWKFLLGQCHVLVLVLYRRPANGCHHVLLRLVQA